MSHTGMSELGLDPVCFPIRFHWLLCEVAYWITFQKWASGSAGHRLWNPQGVDQGHQGRSRQQPLCSLETLQIMPMSLSESKSPWNLSWDLTQCLASSRCSVIAYHVKEIIGKMSITAPRASADSKWCILPLERTAYTCNSMSKNLSHRYICTQTHIRATVQVWAGCALPDIRGHFSHHGGWGWEADNFSLSTFVYGVKFFLLP